MTFTIAELDQGSMTTPYTDARVYELIKNSAVGCKCQPHILRLHGDIFPCSSSGKLTKLGCYIYIARSSRRVTNINSAIAKTSMHSNLTVLSI